MNTPLKIILLCIGCAYASTGRAAVNLGPIAGDRVATFSYVAGPVNLEYHFSLDKSVKLTLIEADLTAGGTFAGTLTLAAAPPDPTPPPIVAPGLLDIALELVASLDAQLTAAVDQLARDLSIQDEQAVALDQIRLKDLQDKRAFELQLIAEILNAPPVRPLALFASDSVSGLAEGGSSDDARLGPGSYSLVLAGVASGRGGGSISFGVSALPTGAVPEIPTWIAMLGGFGLVGASMRRRSARRLSAHPA